MGPIVIISMVFLQWSIWDVQKGEMWSVCAIPVLDRNIHRQNQNNWMVMAYLLYTLYSNVCTVHCLCAINIWSNNKPVIYGSNFLACFEMWHTGTIDRRTHHVNMNHSKIAKSSRPMNYILFFCWLLNSKSSEEQIIIPIIWYFFILISTTIRPNKIVKWKAKTLVTWIIGWFDCYHSVRKIPK